MLKLIATILREIVRQFVRYRLRPAWWLIARSNNTVIYNADIVSGSVMIGARGQRKSIIDSCVFEEYSNNLDVPDLMGDTPGWWWSSPPNQNL